MSQLLDGSVKGLKILDTKPLGCKKILLDRRLKNERIVMKRNDDWMCFGQQKCVFLCLEFRWKSNSNTRKKILENKNALKNERNGEKKHDNSSWTARLTEVNEIQWGEEEVGTPSKRKKKERNRERERERERESLLVTFVDVLKTDALKFLFAGIVLFS